MITELKPIFDGRKSFYGKAIVEETKKGSNLYSYNTLVCKIENRKLIVLNGFELSYTTCRHIKEFAKQNSFDVNSKKDILTYRLQKV